MSPRPELLKLKKAARAVANLYLVADRKRQLLAPILADSDLLDTYNRSYAAHGVTLLQQTLFMDLVRDGVAFVLDPDKKAASLKNVIRLFNVDRVRKKVKKEYCEPLPSSWIGPDIHEDVKSEIRRRLEDERRARHTVDFEGRYDALVQGAEELFATDLARRLLGARNKLIAHYELAASESDPDLLQPEDLSLTWGDADDLLDTAEPLIFDALLLVEASSFDLEDFKENHKTIAMDFWKLTKPSA